MVTDFNRLEAMCYDWDSFMELHAPSPFFLMGLLKNYFDDCEAATSECRPLAFVMSQGNRPLGLAVFRIVDDYILRRPKLFRFRRVEFLLPDVMSPDFVVQPEYLDEFVEGVLPFLFDRLKCKQARLTLPSGSPSALVLRQWSASRGVNFGSELGHRHAVLKVEETWEKYLKSLGKKYVDSCRRLERKLDEAGKWSVSCEKVESQALVDKVLEVDRKSWKQEWRKNRGEAEDRDLAGILNYYRYEPRSRFCPLVWLLELNGKPIAFASVVILGGVAYQPKASYDESYSDLGPGKVLDMMMFRALFESGSVSHLEFFAFYDYMKEWAPEVKSRETVLIENYGRLYELLVRVKQSRWAMRFWRAVSHERKNGIPTERGPRPSGDLEIGTFEDGDMDQVIEIEKSSFPDPIPAGLFASFKSKVGEGFIVARKHGRVVGYLILETRKGQGHIVSLAVATNHRSTGIGEALLRESIHRSAGRSSRLTSHLRRRRIYCEVRRSNRASMSLVHKLLFKETGEIKKGVYPDGEDGIVLERIL